MRSLKVRAGLTIGLLGLLALLSAAGAAAGTGRGGERRTKAENLAAARTDAAKLLASVRLPSGATRTASGPDNVGPLPASSLNVVDVAHWRVAGFTPTQLIAAVRANPPAGATPGGDYSSGSAGTTTLVGFAFSLAPVPGVLAQRLIDVTASALSGGASAVTVQALSVAVVPRTAASLLPAATRVIGVTVATSHGRVLQSATVTAVSRVRATVRFFNQLSALQPGVFSCPAIGADANVIRVSFAGASGAPALAQTSFSDDFAGTSGECNPVSLTVGGRTEESLIGGSYVASLNRLLGTHLPT